MIEPAFSLDFTAASLDSSVTFNRTTGASNPATYVNSSGVIIAATNNEPRFDYDPVTLACKGFLIEESKTNLLTYSEQFDNAAVWPLDNSAVTPNAVIAPDGNNSGDLFYPTITGSNCRILRQYFSLTGGAEYTQSVYVKAAGKSWVYFNGVDATSAANDCWFDIQNGVIGQKGNAVLQASISPAGNGWFRISASGLATVNSYFFFMAVDGNNTKTSTANGNDGVYLWGAQLELGSSPTSYIPTTTTALTRNADVATITGTDFSDWWKTGFGGATVQALPSTVFGIRPMIQFDDGTANEIIALRSNTTNPELYIVDGGTPQAQIDAGIIAANTSYSLTGWWATNDCKARKDSGSVVTDTAATIPTVTQARLGSDGTNYLNGHLASINYYDHFSGQIYTRRKNKAVFTVI